MYAIGGEVRRKWKSYGNTNVNCEWGLPVYNHLQIPPKVRGLPLPGYNSDDQSAYYQSIGSAPFVLGEGDSLLALIGNLDEPGIIKSSPPTNYSPSKI